MSQEDAPNIFFRKLNVKWEDPIVFPSQDRPFHFDEAPEKVKCEHKSRISFDEEDRTLTCMGCGKSLDPFWVIKHWRDIYRNHAYMVEKINAHKAEEAARRKKQQERRKNQGESPQKGGT